MLTRIADLKLYKNKCETIKYDVNRPVNTRTIVIVKKKEKKNKRKDQDMIKRFWEHSSVSNTELPEWSMIKFFLID